MTPFEKPLSEDEINKATEPLSEFDKVSGEEAEEALKPLDKGIGEKSVQELAAEANEKRIGEFLAKLGEHVLEANDEETVDKVNELREDLRQAAKNLGEEEFAKYAENAVENVARDYR